MSLPKPYEKRFFSKISYQPLFPKMDTDRDGVPDFKDCRPFDPTKQHEEPVQESNERYQYGESVNLYLLNPETKRWDNTGEYIVGESFQTTIDELRRMFGHDAVYIAKGKQKSKLKQQIKDYVEERDFKGRLKQVGDVDKKVVRDIHKSAFSEGPLMPKGIMKREREMTLEKSSPWLPYNPVKWHQCSTGHTLVKAPWQTGDRWQDYVFKLPYQRRGSIER